MIQTLFLFFGVMAAEPAKVPTQQGYEVFELGMKPQPKHKESNYPAASVQCGGTRYEQNDAGAETCLKDQNLRSSAVLERQRQAK